MRRAGTRARSRGLAGLPALRVEAWVVLRAVLVADDGQRHRRMREAVAVGAALVLELRQVDRALVGRERRDDLDDDVGGVADAGRVFGHRVVDARDEAGVAAEEARELGGVPRQN